MQGCDRGGSSGGHQIHFDGAIVAGVARRGERLLLDPQCDGDPVGITATATAVTSKDIVNSADVEASFSRPF